MKICECASTIRNPFPADRLHCQTCAGWIPVGRHPSPDTIGHALSNVRALLNALDDAYRWTYHATYNPAVGDRISSRTSISNPTLGLITDTGRRRARAHLTISARLLERSTQTLIDSVGALNDALTMTNSSAPDDHTPEPFHDPRSFPRTTEISSLEQARAAQQRRQARGDGWGAS